MAVVTGGSRGIGRAIAEHAVARGARVGLIARDRDALQATLDGLGGSGVGAVAVADVASRASSRRRSPSWPAPSGPPTSSSTTPDWERPAR